MHMTGGFFEVNRDRQSPSHQRLRIDRTIENRGLGQVSFFNDLSWQKFNVRLVTRFETLPNLSIRPSSAMLTIARAKRTDPIFVSVLDTRSDADRYSLVGFIANLESGFKQYPIGNQARYKVLGFVAGNLKY